MGAQAPANAPPGTEPAPAAVIPVVDSGWSTATSTSDCATGLGDDSWELTLSDAKRVTVGVQDCCCPGDYFEVFVNGAKIGTTPNLAPPWGCDFSGPSSSGSFTVPLCPGTHQITVRDAGFDGHSLTEIQDQNMCPAGFTVTGSLASLAPTQELVARGLQHLDVEGARRQGISPQTLAFGHRMVALDNRVIIAALHDREPDLTAADFEFIEPYYLVLAQGDACTDRDHPAACPARVDSGLCFSTRQEAVDHLEAQGSSGWRSSSTFTSSRSA